MPNEQADFIAKLQQIEEVALISGSNAQDTRDQSSFRHIALIARALKARLSMGLVQVVPGNQSASQSPQDFKRDSSESGPLD
jgi:hypothetical protein